jgi:hypothetical protein
MDKVEEIEGLGIFIIKDGKRTFIEHPDELFAKNVDLKNAKVRQLSFDEIQSLKIRPDEPEPGPNPGPRPIPPRPLPSGRFAFDYENQVGDAPSHRMHTRGAFNPVNGYLTATTRIWTITQLGGFHGCVQIIFFDKEQQALGSTGLYRWGVDGRLIGRSDRTEFWSEQLDVQNVASKAVFLIIAYGWKPDEMKQIVKKAVEIAEPAASLLQKLDQIGSTISNLYTKIFGT